MEEAWKMPGMQLRRTRRPWFGPKRLFGWGWRVTSWQGWVVTVVIVGLIIAADARWGAHAWPAVVGLLVVYLVIILLTGDPPGGAWRPAKGREPR
jgi:hypothetical protein